MDWISEIRAAQTRIEQHIQITPTMTTKALMPYAVDLKMEYLQHTGTFKARGAFNTLLSSPVPDAGIVAASGGNHGAAVAYAAHELGHRAKVFVPEIAGPAKISLIERSGADLTVTEGAYSNALEAAQAYEAQTNALQIHAYDAPATVIGQGTCFAEWVDQGLNADTLLIAVGGGGLIAGALAFFGTSKKIVAVEPDQSCALNAALTAGQPTKVEVSGIAANALGAAQIGQICFDLATQNNATSLTVTDDAIRAAQIQLWQTHRLYVEPAGATALAALTSGAYTPQPGERVAILLCGANPVPDPFT